MQRIYAKPGQLLPLVALFLSTASLAEAGSFRFCYDGEQPVYMALQNPTNFMPRESWGWIQVGGKTTRTNCRGVGMPEDQRRYVAFATFNSKNEMVPLYVTSPVLQQGGQAAPICVVPGSLPGTDWRYSGRCGDDAVSLRVSFVLIGGTGSTHVVDIPENITEGATVSEEWKQKSSSNIFEP